MDSAHCTSTAAQRWREALAEWAIPEDILAMASQGPFHHAPEVFAAPEPGTFELSLSDTRALESLGRSGSVLDVGCGGGAASLALAPPASEVIGVDHQQDMLDLFARTARSRRIAAETFLGSWPGDADAAPAADVVVCHHVLYNVGDIAGLVAALDAHARRRVVIEATLEHPQAHQRPLWRHFWNLERPAEPTASSAVEAIREAGFDPTAETAELPPGRFDPQPSDARAAMWSRQLCLPLERAAECAALMAGRSFTRERVTIWWDTDR